MMKKLICGAISIFFVTSLHAQGDLTYQLPPQEILELVDVPLAPSVLMDEEREHMVLLYRDAFRSIAELSRKELRLAGLRIDPVTNIGSRTTYYNDLRVRPVNGTGNGKRVEGLPENPLLSNFTWSPGQRRMAFTHTTETGVELWIMDVIEGTAVRLTGPTVNANMGDEINWFEDGRSMLVKMIPSDREPLIETAGKAPAGPTVSVASGEKAQNRTYQDLLKNPGDEFNFEQLARSEIVRVYVDGHAETWLGPGMYRGIRFSPDGSYVLVSRLEKPFSYLVPYYRFPSVSTVYDTGGTPVREVLRVPLTEVLPQGFMAVREGPRNLSWRNDRPATLVFTEALDGGDPRREVPYRDELFQLEAPFDGEPVSLLKTVNRLSTVTWGNDRLAVASDSWFTDRNTKTYLFDPSDPEKEPVILFDRNSQDRYSDPGRFVTHRNAMGSRVLSLDGSKAFLIGSGYSERGQFPFLDELDLKRGKSTRIYQSDYTDRLEILNDYDPGRNRLLVRIESPTEHPNYFFRDLKGNRLTPLTNFENPFRSLRDVHKEVLTYSREDGLELSGTLYLPPDYDTAKKAKAPMILWAYPREYKDRSSAGQTTANPNRFTRPYYGSPVYWVTRGYVVLDGAAFPIVGEGNEEPNDTFREQLVANAKAAIDAVDALGYIDRNRVAVGGHSYGAFMVANLLSHSDLFAAGIARSGAYNRTLTPFGFQREERTYWEAPDVYYTMSPFMHADKMKTPLLLIHGEADNNSGTYPMQSTRYFHALKGLGATARLVILPGESHGYRARESILHMLWEQDRWLEMHLK